MNPHTATAAHLVRTLAAAARRAQTAADRLLTTAGDMHASVYATGMVPGLTGATAAALDAAALAAASAEVSALSTALAPYSHTIPDVVRAAAYQGDEPTVDAWAREVEA